MAGWRSTCWGRFAVRGGGRVVEAAESETLAGGAVGRSRARRYSRLALRRQKPRCHHASTLPRETANGGAPVAAYYDDLNTIATLQFTNGAEETLDVQAVPDARCSTFGGSPGDGEKVWLRVALLNVEEPAPAG